MIEKMNMVYIVAARSDRQKMLTQLRNLGLVHLAEKKGPDKETADRFALLSRTAATLKEYAPKKEAAKAAAQGASHAAFHADAGDSAEAASRAGAGDSAEAVSRNSEILTDEEFEEVYSRVLDALDRKAELAQERSAAAAEYDRIQSWGDFSPEAVQDLRDQGYDLHFYQFGKKEYEKAAQDDRVQLIRLASVDKQITAAVLGSLPEDLSGAEFSLPDQGLGDLQALIESCDREDGVCDQILREAARCEASFQDQLIRAQNEADFSSANETADSDENFVWITGYVPEADMDSFRQAAAAGGWAWAAQDVEEEDEKVPTKLRFNKVSRLIKPVFDILGVLPGYREQDISLWFLLFFTLFFAMIIGDAGYGALLLLATLGFSLVKKQKNDTIFLLLVLSIGTVCWGAVTGTWFGLEGAMKVPFLKALVIPSFANYPEYFGVTAQAQQNTIIKFSFSVGAIQMALGSILSIKKKLSEKNLSWVADLGWTIAVAAMYLLSLYLVVGEKINIKPVFALVGVGFVLVLLFGGMAPGLPFGKGLLAGVSNGFTVFLDTISCFGNVMSYIRLFAVGMAGLAIAQSFNSLAEGFQGPQIIVGILVFLIGHTLNIIMCFLSVVVHGVRLNVLEFSGQVGLEWTGIPYEPFQKSTKLKK